MHYGAYNVIGQNRGHRVCEPKAHAQVSQQSCTRARAQALIPLALSALRRLHLWHTHKPPRLVGWPACPHAHTCDESSCTRRAVTCQRLPSAAPLTHHQAAEAAAERIAALHATVYRGSQAQLSLNRPPPLLTKMPYDIQAGGGAGDAASLGGTAERTKASAFAMPSSKYKSIEMPSATTIERAASPPHPTLPRRSAPKSWRATTRERYPLTASLTGEGVTGMGAASDSSAPRDVSCTSWRPNAWHGGGAHETCMYTYMHQACAACSMRMLARGCMDCHHGLAPAPTCITGDNMRVTCTFVCTAPTNWHCPEVCGRVVLMPAWSRPWSRRQVRRARSQQWWQVRGRNPGRQAAWPRPVPRATRKCVRLHSYTRTARMSGGVFGQSQRTPRACSSGCAYKRHSSRTYPLSGMMPV